MATIEISELEVLAARLHARGEEERASGQGPEGEARADVWQEAAMMARMARTPAPASSMREGLTNLVADFIGSDRNLATADFLEATAILAVYVRDAGGLQIKPGPDLKEMIAIAHCILEQVIARMEDDFAEADADAEAEDETNDAAAHTLYEAVVDAAETLEAAIMDDETASDIIDAVFGEGATEDLAALAEMTVQDLTDAVRPEAEASPPKNRQH